VDPSLLDRQRTASVLEAVGYEVVQADNLADAGELLARAAPGSLRAVITELHFPAGDVFDLIRQMRSDPAWSGTPLLVVTSPPPIPLVVELVAAGVNTIVSKPWSVAVLLRRLKESLDECSQEAAAGRVSWNLVEYVRRELKRADRSRSHLSLMVLHLPPGLAEAQVPGLIQSIARNLRESDLVARIGPRQVAIVLPETEAEGAEAVVRRLESVLGPVRVGTAVYPTEAADADLLLRLARERAGEALQFA
jgi:two-component system chemotaxis response regulator CheY